MFCHITANLRGPVRRVRADGREYLVAPLTLIVPGVLNGSKGALYYPPDEVAADPSAWNGTPLVVYHPRSPDGAHLSAREPGILDEQGVGLVRKAKTNGKLTAEGWFDVEATRRVDPSVLEALERGDKIELSTGLYTDNEPAPPGATDPRTGRPYDYIARKYRPDHVAVLPDQQGACSLRDGCGVNVNTERNEPMSEPVSEHFGHYVERNGVPLVYNGQPMNYDVNSPPETLNYDECASPRLVANLKKRGLASNCCGIPMAPPLPNEFNEMHPKQRPPDDEPEEEDEEEYMEENRRRLKLNSKESVPATPPIDFTEDASPGLLKAPGRK